MEKKLIRCCANHPDFHVIYSVSDSEKNYLVCSDCIVLDCFSKYILSKVPIQVQNEKNFQNEISEQTDENKIEPEKENDENQVISEESEDTGSYTGGFIQ